jgi:hypothetical protein
MSARITDPSVVECLQDLRRLLEIGHLSKEGIQIKLPLWTHMWMETVVHEVKAMVESVHEKRVSAISTIRIMMDQMPDQQDPNLLGQWCRTSITLLLQILPGTEEEILLMTTCSLQYSNRVAINKLSPFSLNLTFAVEHNLKQQYLRWLAKHLLCQTHTPNKATTMAMEIANIIKVPVSEALLLDKAMVAMMTLLSKMAFNHQHKAYQQLQGLAPGFLVVYPVVLNQGLLVYLMAQLQSEECRGSLLLMLVAFLNTHLLSVQA